MGSGPNPYALSGTNTINTKFGESPSFFDYGAVGDGVTDDSTAINNALASSRYVVVPPNRVFLCNKTIVIANSNVTLAGDRTSVIRLGNSVNKPLLLVTPFTATGTMVQNVRIQGVDLDGNSTNQTLSYPTLSVNANDCTIDTCRVLNSNGDGLAFAAGVSGCTVFNTKSTGNAGYGLNLGTGVQVAIVGCNFSSNPAGAAYIASNVYYAFGNVGISDYTPNDLIISNSLSLAQFVNNAGGTTNKLFAKLTTGNTVKTALVSDTSGVVGPVFSGAGTSGLVTISIGGFAVVTFDGTASGGDYVQLSPTSAGHGHDAGSTYPSSGQVLGRVMGHVSGNNYLILVFGPEIQAGGSGGGGSGSTVQLPNDPAGTANTLFCILTSSGTVKTALTSTTSGVVGPVLGNGGTSGDAIIAVADLAIVLFDGSATPGNYVQLSTTNAGYGHDAGSSFPGSGQVLGQIVQNVTGDLYLILVFTQQVQPSAGGLNSTVQLVNNSAGTTNGLFCVLTGGQAKTAPTTATGGVVGPVLQGGGTSGNCIVTVLGLAAVTFDGTATPGDYVQLSTSSAGKGHDIGSVYPTSGQVLGRVIALISGSSYTVLIFPPEIQSGGSGSSPVRAIGYVFDSPGVSLTARNSAPFVVPFSCTINSWSIALDAGTCTIKVYKIAAGTAIPTSANSINTSGVSISTGTVIESTTLTDFTTLTVTAGDIIIIALTVVSGATQVGFVLGAQ